jgi:hypothetical protein
MTMKRDEFTRFWLTEPNQETQLLHLAEDPYFRWFLEKYSTPSQNKCDKLYTSHQDTVAGPCEKYV